MTIFLHLFRCAAAVHAAIRAMLPVPRAAGYTSGSPFLMAGSRKKVIVRTVSDGLHAGYLPLAGIVEDRDHGPVISLLDPDGRMLYLPLESVRSVAYVRDFNLGDRVDPERLSRRTFMARPRTEGLWVRLTLVDGDLLEGLAPLDLTLFDGVLEDRGLFLIPPDIRSNTQRLYIPRAAITAVQLLAVITTPSKTKPVKPGTAATKQDLLFPDPPR